MADVSVTREIAAFFAGLSKRATGVTHRAEHDRRNTARTVESQERAATR